MSKVRILIKNILFYAKRFEIYFINWNNTQILSHLILYLIRLPKNNKFTPPVTDFHKESEHFAA